MRVPLGTFWLIAAALAWPGCSGMFSGTSEYDQVKQVERDFGQLMTNAGGSAKKEGRQQAGFEGTGWFIDLSGATISDEIIAAIGEKAGRDPMFELNLSKSTISDDQLGQLDTAKVLQKCFILDLSGTAVTDSGLDKCVNVHCLQDLKITGSKATAEGAKRLGERKVNHPQTPKPFRVPPKVAL